MKHHEKTEELMRTLSPQVAKTLFSLRWLLKSLEKLSDLQAPVCSCTPFISNASAIVLTELVNLYTLLGLAVSQFRSSAGFVLCMALIVLQILEILALFRSSLWNPKDFAQLALVFALLQDLPQFLFTIGLSAVGGWNQYVFYTLISSTLALLTLASRLLSADEALEMEAQPCLMCGDASGDSEDETESGAKAA